MRDTIPPYAPGVSSKVHRMRQNGNTESLCVQHPKRIDRAHILVTG
jgi:hypothetical protein